MTSSSPEARTRTRDPDGVRRRILDAAAGLFQTRGFNATGMQDIYAEAQVTSGAFYHHFIGKKELGIAIIRERVAAAVDETWLEPVRSAATARQGIKAAFTNVIRGLDAGEGVRGCPLNNLTLELAYAEPEFRVELKAVFDGWRRTIAEKISQDRARGELETSDPKALAEYVVAVYSGAMALCKVDQSSAPLADGLRQLSRTLAKPRS